MTTEILDRLDELLTEATPGPWHAGAPSLRLSCLKCSGPYDNRANIYEGTHNTDVTSPHAHMHKADALLVCYLRNHARELIDIARKAGKVQLVYRSAGDPQFADEQTVFVAPAGTVYVLDTERATFREMARKVYR